jgi:predicted site-specific integrase-resolvase
MSELLTVSDLCQRWGCSPRTIERYRRQGLVAVKIGGVRFDLEDVEEFEQSRKTGRVKKKNRRRSVEPEMSELR